MIRRVAQHYLDTDGNWVIRLMCGHVMFTAGEDHARVIKARHCPSCPEAERAEKADYRNELEHRMKRVVEASKPLADLLKGYGKPKDSA